MSQPDVRLLDWAAQAVGGTVRTATSLRGKWGPWLLEVDGGPRSEAILKIAPDGEPDFLATEAAAMTLATAHGLPTPATLAVDITGEEAGTSALLRSFITGDATVPRQPTTQRLQGFGATIAAFHRVPLTPTRELPVIPRHMPWKDLRAARRAGQEPSTPLLDEADAALEQLPVPDDDLVFVHGDLWAGNALWDGDSCVGIIDWDGAGAGSYGVDLGSLRLDAALFYDTAACDEVLAGWEAASHRRAQNVAYWDLVAALNVEADATGSEEAMQSTGRLDLDGETMNCRRDAFVEDALARLRG